jgi:hypothetical protein
MMCIIFPAELCLVCHLLIEEGGVDRFEWLGFRIPLSVTTNDVIIASGHT